MREAMKAGYEARKSFYNRGKTYLPEYRIWSGIKQRCYNNNRSNYKYYGGRGIIVCDRWLNSFDDFYKDMGPRPGKGYSIDRRDNNGDYEPSNCYWATAEQQRSNKRPHQKQSN